MLRGPDLNQRPSGYGPDELPGCSKLSAGRRWVGAGSVGGISSVSGGGGMVEVTREDAFLWPSLALSPIQTHQYGYLLFSGLLSRLGLLYRFLPLADGVRSASSS